MYSFELETASELAAVVANNIKRRRLEKGMSRQTLSNESLVPVPTIVKFENEHTISFVSFIAIAKALGYSNEIKNLLSEPKYNTMAELDTINKNKNRKRGSL